MLKFDGSLETRRFGGAILILIRNLWFGRQLDDDQGFQIVSVKTGDIFCVVCTTL